MHLESQSYPQIFYNKASVIVLISLLATAGSLAYWQIHPTVIDAWEMTVYDQRMRWAEKALSHPDIVLIGRDLESERQFGHGIWDRAVFAKVITGLGQAGASVVSLDFAFVGPSPPERGGQISDQLLAKAIKDMGNVVLPLPVQLGNLSPGRQIGHERPKLDQFSNMFGAPLKVTDAKQLETASLIGSILPELFASTHRWGHIASVWDKDGVFRRVPAFLHVDNHAVPALGVAIAASYLNAQPKGVSIELGKHVTIQKANHPNSETSAPVIPVDEQNQLLVSYAGVWNDAPFTYLLFSDVLETITKDKLDELQHWVKGKIVIIFHAGAEHDKRRTPLELHAPGGFIHANVVQTILTSTFMTDISIWIKRLIVLCLTMLTAACVVYFPWRSGWISILIVMGIYVMLTQLAFSSSGKIYPLVLPLLGIVGSTGLAYAWVIWTGKQQFQHIEATLEQSQHELVRARERLAETESTVEQLEEDLQANRTEALLQETNQKQAAQNAQKFEAKLRMADIALNASQREIKQLEKDLEVSQRQFDETELHQPEAPQLQELERQKQAAETTLQITQSEVSRLENALAESRKQVVVAETNQREAVQNAQKLETKLHATETKLDTSRKEIAQRQHSRPHSQATAIKQTILTDQEHKQLQEECEKHHHICTNDSLLLSQFKDLKKVAKTHMSILILGEPGTGKELFARAVHDLSERSGDFVPTNMAAIPQHMFEAQWFGHAKGAFTDAKQDHKGFFNQAYGGTIFLDEIGDLALDMQAKLLRALETKVITPLGSTQSKTIDVRVVAATNKDLLQGVSEGWFRRDLYDRLLGFTLMLPPLRERKNDVELLAQRIVQRASQESGRENLQLSKDAVTSIKNWAWPGNIRELEKCLTLTVALTDGDEIRMQDLRMDPHAQAQNEGIATTDEEVAQDVSGDQALLQCLRQNGFDMQNTAKTVGWERSTVTQRLKGLCFQALVDHQFDRSNAANALAQGDPITARLVELKLNGYYDHLLKLMASCRTAEEAIALCRQRLKNFPDRHLHSMDTLVRHNFKP